jgi:hypothetical protein
MRIASYLHDSTLVNLTAFSLFAKGVGFIYAGQEVKASHKPDLFEKDTADLNVNDEEFYQLVKKLISLRNDGLYLGERMFTITDSVNHNGVITAYYSKDEETVVGLFNLSGTTPRLDVSSLVNDGSYCNLLGNNDIRVKDGLLLLDEYPLIVRVKRI